MYTVERVKNENRGGVVGCPSHPNATSSCQARRLAASARLNTSFHNTTRLIQASHVKPTLVNKRIGPHSMASNGVSSQMNDLHLSDTDTEDLFASPSHVEQKKAQKSKRLVSENTQIAKTPASSSKPNPTSGESKYDTEEAREAALRKELVGIRNINQVVEGVIESLDKSKGNMDVRGCSPHSLHMPGQAPKLICIFSLYLVQLRMLALSYKPGPASCLRPNIINASY